jgi:predicted amidohydrolase
MSRIVRCGLIQASNAAGSNRSLPEIKKAMIDKHLKLIAEAAKKKVKILCLQELFYGPYFCAEQDPLVRPDRARPRWPDHAADAKDRRQIQHGDRRAGL